MRHALMTLALAAVLIAGMTHPIAAQQRNLPPGEWQSMESGAFTIYHEPQDEPAAKALMETYRASARDFSEKLGVEIPHPVTVFLAPNPGRFRYLTRGMPEWTGGAAYPQQKVIILKVPRLYPSRGQFAVTALHELVHVLTGGSANLPRWFSEGVAMLLSGETMYEDRTPLARAVVMNKTHTLDDIENMLRFGPGQARVAYLQSIDFVKFLVERYGWGTVAELLNGYKEGRAEDAMFTQITGRDLFDVEVAWHQELRHRYRWWKLLQWLDFDMILWGGASLLVAVAGGLAIWRRRKYLHSMDEESEATWQSAVADDPPPGEWYVEDEDTWR